MSVRVDAETAYEPDAFVRFGQPFDGEATAATDRLIVVEVVSRAPHKRDSGMKLEDYFRIPSVRQDLIVRTESRARIHHRRHDMGVTATHVIRSGAVRLVAPVVEFALPP